MTSITPLQGLWTIQKGSDGRWADHIHVTRRAAWLSFEAAVSTDPEGAWRVLNDKGEPVVGLHRGPPHGDVNAAS